MTRPQLIHSPHHGAAEDAEVFVIDSADGVRLRAARWITDDARGTVLLCHGFTEFIEKYYEVVDDLRRRRYSVVTFDWRGQGLSTRLIADQQRGYVESFDDFVDDALRVADALTEPGQPLLLVAHSMGGNVALRLLQEHPERFERAVLCAPMLGWDWLPTDLIGAVAARQVRRGHGERYIWGGRDPDTKTHLFRVTSDEARLERWKELCRREPGLLLGSPTWQWMREAARSTSLVTRPERIARIAAPTLLASAGRDYVVSAAKQRRLASRSDRISLVEFPDAMHEILHETDPIRGRFWSAFDDFVG